MAYNFAYKDFNDETMARSVVLAASVSTKHCIEICSRLRGKKTDTAKRILEQCIAMEKPIPFRRFNHNVGHRRGMGPGRYPVKACKEILKLIRSAEANANNKGLNSEELKIIHILANMAARPWHYGRQRRRKMKRTNIEVVVQELIRKEKPKRTSQKPNKEDPKAKEETKSGPVKEKKDEPKKSTQPKDKRV